MTPTDRYVRIREVCRITGMGRTFVYTHPEFPKPYRLSERIVGWKESEVRAWMDSRRPLRDDYVEAS